MKRIVWLLCLCAALLPLAGCSGTRQAEAPQEAPVVLPYASSLAKQGITGSITLPKRPERVVTLTNSPVLALYELGVPQAAVPDTKILQWPEGLEKQAKKIQTGMRSNIDLESVLAQEPDLLFLDEPTTFLDISYQFEILQLVKDLNRRLGTGVVLVLHDLGQALEISDRVVIRNGRKYCEGPPEAVITPQLMRRVYQVDCDVLYVPGRRKPVLVYKEIQ
jgi:ABC-type hemin transport system ATPase subunit